MNASAPDPDSAPDSAPKSGKTDGARPRRGWRRLRRLLLLLPMLGVVALVAALPQILGTPPVRRLVLEQVNQLYAPTSIELAGVRASWFGSIEMTGLVLRDSEGKAVVSAPRAVLDRSLLQLLLDRPDYGTLTLFDAEADIERHPDGTIDLWEALGPLLASDSDEPSDPRTAFTLKAQGKATLKSPELARAMTGEKLDLTLEVPPAPGKFNWQVRLENPGVNGQRAESVEVDGHYDHRAETHAEILLTIKGDHWPMAVGVSGVEAQTRFNGSLEARQVEGYWTTSGEALLSDLAATGEALGGESPKLELVEAAWDLGQTGDGWDIRRLGLKSPFANLAFQPADPETDPKGLGKVDGQLDLAALLAMFPDTLPMPEGLTLQHGRATVQVHLQDGEPGQRIEARALLSDLLARDEAGIQIGPFEPINILARVLRREEAIVVETFGVESLFLQAEGSGDLDQGIRITGSTNLEALAKQAGLVVDLGEIRLGGQASFAAEYRRQEPGFAGQLAVESAGFVVGGLTETPIQRPKTRIDLALVGPIADSGIPEGWQEARLNLNSGPHRLDTTVQPIEEGYSVVATLAGPLSIDETEAELAETLAIDMKGTYETTADRVVFEALHLVSQYGTLDATGQLEDLTGRRLANFGGSFSPDWDVMNALAAEAISPDARIAGSPRPFRLVGPLSGATTQDILSGLDAEFGVDINEAQAIGLNVGPAPLVIRAKGGQIDIEPIATTLNGGRVDLRPELILEESGAILLRLGPGSNIEAAEINEAVSRSLLAYIAPLLHEATQVRGQVSARFERAEIPISGAAGRSVDLAGQVEFIDVTYGPGPLTQQLLGFVGRGETPFLRINQPVNFAIAEGRVHQSGVSIAATPEISFEIEGSVGLDGTLAMRAGVPLTPAMLGQQEMVSDLVSGTRVGLPIGGTLSNPMLDRPAFQVGLRDASRDIMRRAASRGANQLLDQVVPGAGERLQPGTNGAGAGAGAGQVIQEVGGGLIRGLIPGGDRSPRPRGVETAPGPGQPLPQQQP